MFRSGAHLRAGPLLADATGEILDTAAADADDAFMALATFGGGYRAVVVHVHGHGEPSIPAPALRLARLDQRRTVVLDGQEPTTLDAHWERHGSADAARCSRTACLTRSAC